VAAAATIAAAAIPLIAPIELLIIFGILVAPCALERGITSLLHNDN
jgi:hypothetical protein